MTTAGAGFSTFTAGTALTTETGDFAKDEAVFRVSPGAAFSLTAGFLAIVASGFSSGFALATFLISAGAFFAAGAGLAGTALDGAAFGLIAFTAALAAVFAFAAGFASERCAVFVLEAALPLMLAGDLAPILDFFAAADFVAGALTPDTFFLAD